MKGFRTIAFNLIIGVLAVGFEVTTWLTTFDWTTVLSARQAGVAILAVNAANIVLRFVTTSAVGQRR